MLLQPRVPQVIRRFGLSAGLAISHFALSTFAAEPAARADTIARIAKPKELVVNVALDGVIAVSGKVLTAEELLETLRKVEGDTREYDTVIIRGDENCPLKHVVAVMEACAKAEIRDVRVSVAKADVAR